MSGSTSLQPINFALYLAEDLCRTRSADLALMGSQVDAYLKVRPLYSGISHIGSDGFPAPRLTLERGGFLSKRETQEVPTDIYVAGRSLDAVVVDLNSRFRCSSKDGTYNLGSDVDSYRTLLSTTDLITQISFWFGRISGLVHLRRVLERSNGVQKSDASFISDYTPLCREFKGWKLRPHFPSGTQYSLLLPS
ncbi:hypothetical protein HYV86_03535 [Candidatus Woesearchaeota archaeon]|nr:hypothetical protein [Candidatus Woesearchaeota archaeon]